MDYRYVYPHDWTQAGLVFLLITLFVLAILVRLLFSGHAAAAEMESESVVLFEDHFQENLLYWQTEPQAWKSGDGRLTPQLPVAEITGGHPEWGDYSVEIDFELAERLGPESSVRFFFRRKGPWESYGVTFSGEGSNLAIFRGGSGHTQILAEDDLIPTPGDRHTVTIDVRGKVVTVYLDGALLFAAMDPVNLYTRGEIGIRSETAVLGIHRVRVTGAPDNRVIDDTTWAELQPVARRLMRMPPPERVDGPGYHSPGTDAAGGARDIMLIYTHGGSWKRIDALPYVAYGTIDRTGRLPRIEWRDWFFDTYLFLALLTDDWERAYDSAARAKPANWQDWEQFVSNLFQVGQQLAAFDEAVAYVKAQLADAGRAAGRPLDPAYRAKVIVMIPYPTPEQRDFGDPTGSGRSLDFASSGRNADAAVRDRMAAIRAYVNAFMRRWEERHFENLELIGFYWLSELVHDIPGERETIRATADLVHDLGYRFFWIPYFKAAGYEAWQSLGFDAAILQPNYMFNERISPNRLTETARLAQENGMGVEIEGNGTVLSSEKGRERYLDYLWAGVKYGYMTNALKGYYQDRDLLGKAFISKDPAVREVYDLTYSFVKGALRPD